MPVFKPYVTRFLLVFPVIILVTSCTAGDAQFSNETPAGFFWGLWHGVISVISLIIHLFNDTVAVYEVDNSGGWYDFGFLLGVIMVWGGGCHASCKTKKEKQCDKEWDEIGEKVEKKVMRKLKAWAEEDELPETGEEWGEISDKVEVKLKRKIREWAEKD
ncbi:MAG: hypothetical protein ABW104_21280 [Candidatus Thiodiazotropha sp. 6PLUC2]